MKLAWPGSHIKTRFDAWAKWAKQSGALGHPGNWARRVLMEVFFLGGGVFFFSVKSNPWCKRRTGEPDRAMCCRRVAGMGLLEIDN